LLLNERKETPCQRRGDDDDDDDDERGGRDRLALCVIFPQNAEMSCGIPPIIITVHV
jgi:hypothetical protein